MATLAELVQEQTDLTEPVVTHLQRLVAGWGVLSDLCFADLLLFVPVSEDHKSFLVVGQVRPTTNQTLHLDDLVGWVIDAKERPIVARAWELGSVVEGEVAIPRRSERARLVCIPVRWQGELVAILTRESALAVGRRPGVLERVYIEVFDRLARMISNGSYPFPVDEPHVTETPRVGDGVLVLDAAARVDYASPNAVNALHRMGVNAGIDGIRLDEAGFDQTAVSLAYQTRLPAVEEAGSGETSVIIRCVPLLDQGARHRGAGPRPRRERHPAPGPTPALQGCRHPGGPSPGQEQPPDDLVPAADPIETHATGGKPPRPRRVRAAGPFDCRGARDPLARHH